MTLEKLLGMSGNDWEKLTDTELEEWAQRFYHITRPSPEKAAPVKPTVMAKRQAKHQNAQKSFSELLKFATQMGVAIPDGLKK